MKDIFELKVTVTSENIDDLNHVNNVVYVQWMDTVAFEHWAFLTRDTPLPQYIWVVLKHEIEYLKQAVLGDEITIKTWVGETKGFKSERLMEFYRENQLLVKAKTVWGMLDVIKYKPVRIREDVMKVLYP
ncbi:thioesterase [Polaribacter sp. ALD11]|uniref:acyl-CoA thioesterase n=1 Tax=Polaribacter sp. ALD11 TaxID=2058137 RepID=UPI000C30ABBE|nr:thioesterase [Polaribacter sp. ALD11]